MQSNSKCITDRQRIDSLTGARFLAIMIIVFSHFEFLHKYDKLGEIYWTYFHNATMGVDYFFMLSGFGMMLSSIRKDPDGILPIGGISNLINYARKHVNKIYTVYVIFLLIGIPYHLYIGYVENGQAIGKLIIKTFLFFLIDLTLLQSSTGQTTFSHSLNGVCWFLSSLFCIYLISPIILKITKKYIKTVRLCIVSILITVSLSYILSILFSWLDNHTFFNDLCYGSPYRRVFYVILGMIIAQLYNLYKKDNFNKLPYFVYSGNAEYVFLIISVLWFFMRHSLLSTIGHIVCIIDMTVVCGDLFLLAVCAGSFSKLLSKKKVVYLGEISMYIFLSHYNIGMYINLFGTLSHLESIPFAIIEVTVILFLTMIISVAIKKSKESGNR